MYKPLLRRLCLEQAEERCPASALLTGAVTDWALARPPATAPARLATARPGVGASAAVQGPAAAAVSGRAVPIISPAPAGPARAVSLLSSARPAGRLPSDAFAPDLFSLPFDALAGPLGPTVSGGPGPGMVASGMTVVAAEPVAGSAPSGPTPAASPGVVLNVTPAAPHTALPLLPPALPRHPVGGKVHFADDPGAPPPQPVFDCSLTLTALPYVPVNADDDNGSAVTNGIPAQRDFNVAPMPQGVNDAELLVASLRVQCTVSGSLSIWIASTGTGRVALWTDQHKSAPFTPPAATTPNDQTFTFYIEGQHESSAPQDVSLTANFTYPGNPDGGSVTVTAAQAITVTPVINSFAVTPWGGADGQNVFFQAGSNANGGLTTWLVGSDGALLTPTLFTGSVYYTGLAGSLTFVQNMESVQNGANGGTTYGGNPVGWLYVPGTKDNNNLPIGAANSVVADGAPFPLLDVGPGTTTPDYDGFFKVDKADGTTYAIEAKDGPASGAPNQSQFGTKLDVQYNLSLWLLWRFPATYNAVNVPTYYPIARVNWQAVFLAHSSAGAGSGPIDVIDRPHGVTVNQTLWQGTDTFIRTNQPPDTMSPTTIVNNKTVPNTWNNNNTWNQLH